jgi:hypothetical protein
MSTRPKISVTCHGGSAESVPSYGHGQAHLPSAALHPGLQSGARSESDTDAGLIFKTIEDATASASLEDSSSSLVTGTPASRE